MKQNDESSVSVWDWPLRLFHWLLALAVTGAYISGKLGGSLTDVHERLGALILGLLVFRLIWGFIGSRTARFASFWPNPSSLKAYIKGEWQDIGHNPAGALAVFALLSLLVTVSVTGLFANDDIALEGPLYPWVSKAFSDRLTGWHSLSFYILLGLVSLHLAAMIFYLHVKKINLIKPMLTGNKRLPEDWAVAPIETIKPHAFMIAALISSAIVWGVWL